MTALSSGATALDHVSTFGEIRQKKQDSLQCRLAPVLFNAIFQLNDGQISHFDGQ
jgi:hypothetical protein